LAAKNCWPAADGVLTAPTLDAHNSFEQPDAVVPGAFTGFRRAGGTLEIVLPARSVVILSVT